MKCMLAGMVLLLLAGPWLAPYAPAAQDRVAALTPPDAQHWLGTDEYGRDQWSRFLHGGAWSIATGAAAALLVLALASAVGGCAGYAGGWIDSLLMWLGEVILSLPWLYVVVGVRAAFPPALPGRQASGLLILLIALVSWARPARLIRNVVLSEGQREWVAAARGFGVSRLRAYALHVFPATGDVLAAQAVLLFPRFVLAELTLSFLGAGGGGPDASWGGLIVPLGQLYLLPQQWWLALPAVLMAAFFAMAALAAWPRVHTGERVPEGDERAAIR